jgi:nucleoside-diphosphate-sugar epimerase
MSSGETNVLITGASRSVGYLVFRKLMNKKGFRPIGLVRDKKGQQALLRLGAKPDQIKIGDITQKESLKGILRNVTKVVLATSAQPKKSFWYRFLNFFRKLIGRGRPARGSEIYYPSGQSPYHVDFIGQKNVIDECINEKVEHIVFLGNMGGYKGSKVNEIGRKKSDDPKVGNLLKWKRAAERYLMKRAYFTIVHAAALSDEPGGANEIVWDTDDR